MQQLLTSVPDLLHLNCLMVSFIPGQLKSQLFVNGEIVTLGLS